MAFDTGAEALEELEEQASSNETRFVARMSPRTRAREGGRIEVLADTAALHFVDPATGEPIA